MAYTVSAQTPSLGSIAWSNVHIVYDGVDYAIADGNTNKQFVWFRKPASGTAATLQVANAEPAYGPDDCLVFINRGGVPTSVLDSTAMDGSLIVPGTIMSKAIAAGAVRAEHLSAGAVTADAIEAYAINAEHLTVEAIEARHITAEAIQADHIGARVVTASHLAAGSVTAYQIAAGEVKSVAIEADAIEARHIAADAVTADAIAANAVTALAIKAGEINANHLAADSVTAGKIKAGEIGAAHLAAGAITTDKLFVTGKGAALNDDPACSDPNAWSLTNGGVGGGIAPTINTVTDGSSGNTVIRSGAGYGYVSSRKFALDPGKTYRMRLKARRKSGTGHLWARVHREDGAGAEVSYLSGMEQVTVPTSWTAYSFEIKPEATVRSGYLTLDFNYVADSNAIIEVQDFRIDEAVGADLVVDGAITTNKLNALAVTGDKIAGNTITGDKIVAAQITADHLSVGAVRAQHILVAPKSLNPDPSFEGAWVNKTGNYDRTHPAVPAGCPVSRVATFYGRDSYMPFRIAVKGGEQYRISGWVCKYAGISAAGFIAFGFTSDGSPVLIGVVSSWSDGWQFADNSVTIPEGCVSLSVAPWNNQAHTDTWSSWFGDLQVEKKADASLIVDGQITTSKLAAGAVKAEQIDAGAVRVSHLAVVPQTLNPDPGFDDRAMWQLDTLTINAYAPEVPNGNKTTKGWYTDWADPAYWTGTGNLKCLFLYEGMNGGPGVTRYHAWTKRFPLPFGGAKVRLRVRVDNASNHWLVVALRVFDSSGNMLGDGNMQAAASSRYQDLSAQFSLLPQTAYGEIIIYNQGQQDNGQPFTGAICVAQPILDLAVGADLVVDGAITASKLAAKAITAGTAVIDTGAITNAMIASLSADKITAGTLDAARIAAKSINAGHINGNGLEVRDINGTLLLGSGSALHPAYAAAGTVNSDLLPNIAAAAGTTPDNLFTGSLASPTGTSRAYISNSAYSPDPRGGNRAAVLVLPDNGSYAYWHVFDMAGREPGWYKVTLKLYVVAGMSIVVAATDGVSWNNSYYERATTTSGNAVWVTVQVKQYLDGSSAGLDVVVGSYHKAGQEQWSIPAATGVAICDLVVTRDEAVDKFNKVNSANISTYIADLAVDTLQIAGNAVTIPASQMIGPQLWGQPGYLSSLAASVNLGSAVGSIFISVTLNIYNNNKIPSTITILNNGVGLISFTGLVYPAAGSNANGTLTYVIQNATGLNNISVLMDSQQASCYIYTGSLFAIATKR